VKKANGTTEEFAVNAIISVWDVFPQEFYVPVARRRNISMGMFVLISVPSHRKAIPKKGYALITVTGLRVCIRMIRNVRIVTLHAQHVLMVQIAILVPQKNICTGMQV
jgi:hypothetical protein